MREKFQSTIDVARLLGIPEHRLVYAFRAGKLEEPRFRVAGKRVFTASDVRRVAEYFADDLGGEQ